MALDVEVTISLSKPAGNDGTWYPLLFVVDSTAETDLYGEYTEIDELVKAGYAAESSVYKAAELLFSQEDAPAKIAVYKQKAFSTDGLAKYLNKGWRQLVLLDDTETANAAALATYIEGTDKMLFLSVSDKSALTTLYESVNTCDRPFIVYHTGGKNEAAAVVGATAGLEAGSFTYKNVIIKGVEPMELSDEELEEIHALGACTIVEKAGDIVTSEGKTAAGEYADIVDSNDYIIQNIAYNTQKVLNRSRKVPYTNAGIGMLEAEVQAVLSNGYKNGMIAEDDDGKPLYATSFALRSQTTEVDRAARNYPYGKFSFTLSGAIHTAQISGTVTV